MLGCWRTCEKSELVRAYRKCGGRDVLSKTLMNHWASIGGLHRSCRTQDTADVSGGCATRHALNCSESSAYDAEEWRDKSHDSVPANVRFRINETR